MEKSVPRNTKEQVITGVNILKNGGVIAYPTDTVYGLGASVKHVDAIKRIFRIKNRAYDMALPLLLGDVSLIPEYVLDVPQVASKLIEAFLPGALTLVMIKSDSVPDIVTGGGNTVAIRIPGHPLTLSLLQKTGCAIIGTSANRSGMPSALTAEEVTAQIGRDIDFIIDGGKCPGGKESTIIDVTGKLPKILREGAIPREQIEQVINHNL